MTPSLCLSYAISIHALLAESDEDDNANMHLEFRFLSTLSLRRATAALADKRRSEEISIHALLAESDFLVLPDVQIVNISIHALLAESDLLCQGDSMESQIFLSTLSLRRATQ